MSNHSRQASIASSLISNSNHNHPQKIGPWRLGKTLGRGATGRVLLATHQTTGQKAAVKVVSKSELNEEDVNKKADGAGLPYGIEREIIIMKLLTHPNVLRLYDVWETSKALYLVLEYVEGGELFDLLVERGPLQEPEAIKYFRQIILGTAYCHALGICHRDLKPENLLLDASLNVKLADFGMAALESNGKLLETSCGSPHYAAPEIVSGLKYHGAASDVWSCGVILFALLTGRLPFDDENIRSLLLKVQAGSFDMPEEISEEAKDLLTLMLTVDPMKRIHTELILSHPLLNKYPISNEDLISVKSLPHPETAHKSLGSLKNIDKQILSNLSILWHDRSEQEIIDCLLKNGQNPEKTFYALLMRYRHNQDDQQGSTPHRKRSIQRSGSVSTKDSARRKRSSMITASRPTSFQYRNSNRLSAPSSVTNSPYKTQSKKFNNSQSPIKSPNKSPRRSSVQFGTNGRAPAIPRNIYNEIVSSQNNNSNTQISLPPPIPSKDTLLLEAAQFNESPTKTNKRQSLLSTSASKRFSKRKSLRASMTTGLKRNSITMKLLSTYAKVAGETDWEYMDKQTKRTSATFATLCDKIFNQETYDKEDELLIDEEEKHAKEYERLMEIERKKHEAEIRARKELEKKQQRQKRRSLLSTKKLSIIIRDDDTNNNSEGELASKGSEINQPKRKSNLRSVSESAAEDKNDTLTSEELEQLKTRSVTQPTATRRKTPILNRRPVSKLDPLWIAYENEELDRAKNALDEELRITKEERKKESKSEKSVKKEINFDKRESSLISLQDAMGKRISRDSYYQNKDGYELPEPKMDESDLSEEYLSEIRKSRLLNSQLNINGIIKGEAAKDKKNGEGTKEARTLIADVKIPNVTRKSRCFTNSNKRLSVLSMYSTKDSYRDLNHLLNKDTDDQEPATLPKLRTSFADRLDRAGLGENEEMEEEPLDEGSILDFDEHLANKRYSYYDGNKRNSRFSTISKNKRHSRPISQLPNLPNEEEDEDVETEGEDETFASRNDRVHRRKSDKAHNSPGDAEVFEKIKLPDANKMDSKSQKARKTKSMLPSAESMLIPNPDMIPNSSKPYQKVRTPAKTDIATPDDTTETIPPTPPAHTKKPLDDSTNRPTAPPQQQKRNRSIFRKLSWGSKKALDENSTQLPSPDNSRAGSVEEKKSNSFFRWFSSSSQTPTNISSEIQRINTILPKQEMSTALFALLNSWSNFGLKNLKNDTVGYNITGAISKNNSFDLKSCKFRIKINSRAYNQKSEIVCARIKGSKITSDTLFKEIEKVLIKEGVIDK